jgi:DNA-binding NtrC family response regulator
MNCGGALLRWLAERSDDALQGTVRTRLPAAKGESVYSVLLVDDDPNIRKSVGDMLTRSGYEVVTAPDGEEALGVLRQASRIELVIADYKMPGMDGLQLVRRIKEEAPNMPVVIMTGHGDLESYLCATGLGVIRYIGKPVGLRELQRTVRDAVAEGLCERTLRQVSS